MGAALCFSHELDGRTFHRNEAGFLPSSNSGQTLYTSCPRLVAVGSGTVLATDNRVQISVAPKDVCKTGVITPLGQLKFMGMPMSMKNAAQTLRRTLNHLLRKLDFVHGCQDHILDCTGNCDQRWRHLEEVLALLQAARLLELMPNLLLRSHIRWIPHQQETFPST